MAQNIGEVISFILTSFIIIYYSWQASFIVPAIICMLIAVVIHFTIKDRPTSYGLPSIEHYKNDFTDRQQAVVDTSLKQQLYL